MRHTIREILLAIYEPGVGFNPVLVHDLRAKLRHRRAFATLFVVVGLGCLALGVSLAGELGMRTYNPGRMVGLGRDLFTTLSMALTGIVSLVAVTQSCTSVAGERDRQTLEFMLMTPVPRLRLLVGKCLGAACYAALLAFCSLPLLAITFMLGGVSPAQLVVLFLLTLVYIIFMAAAGVLASCISSSTRLAAGNSVLAAIVYLAAVTSLVSMSNSAARSFSPFVAAYTLTQGQWSSRFFHTTLPFYLPALVVLPLAAALLLALGQRGLDQTMESDVAVTRWLGVATYLALVVVLIGSWWPYKMSASGDYNEIAAPLFGVALILGFLACATAWPAAGRSAREAAAPFRHSPLSPFTYGLTLWGAGLGAYLLFRLLYSRFVVADIGRLAPGFTLALSVMLFTAALGAYCSLLWRNRQLGIRIACLAYALWLIWPVLAWGVRMAGWLAETGGQGHDYPFPAVVCIPSVLFGFLSTMPEVNRGLIAQGLQFSNLWQYTSLCHLALAGILLLLAAGRVARRNRVVDNEVRAAQEVEDDRPRAAARQD